MSSIQPVQIEDADGTTYTVLTETTNPTELPATAENPDDEDDYESYSPLDDAHTHLKNMHGTICVYS